MVPLGLHMQCWIRLVECGPQGRVRGVEQCVVWPDRVAQAMASLVFLLLLLLVLPPGAPVCASAAKCPLAVRGDPYSGLGGVQLPYRCHSRAHTTYQCPDPAAYGGACDQCPPTASGHLVRAYWRPREVLRCSCDTPRPPLDIATKGSVLGPTDHHELTLLRAKDGVNNNNNNIRSFLHMSGVSHVLCMQ